MPSVDQSFTLDWDAFLDSLFSNETSVSISGQVVFKRTCGKHLCFVFIQEFVSASDENGRIIQLVFSDEVSDVWNVCCAIRKGDVVQVNGRRQASNAKWERVCAEIVILSAGLLQPWQLGRSIKDCFKSVKRFGEDPEQDVPAPPKPLFPRPSHARTLEPMVSSCEHPHAHRAKIFADWLLDTYGDELSSGPVLDVAGGAGDLAFELYTRGLQTITIDPRSIRLTPKLKKALRRRGLKVNQRTGEEWLQNNLPRLDCYLDEKLFDERPELFRSCSVIVGMHPDQATGYLVQAAMKFDKPFATVPCCVFRQDFPDRMTRRGQVETHGDLVEWILEQTSGRSVNLPFEGKSTCVFRFCSPNAKGGTASSIG